MTTLLLTLDYINDIIHPDGKIPSCAKMLAEHQTLARANQAIAWARRQKLPIAHVKVGFDSHYNNCPRHSPVFGKAPEFKALTLGQWGTEFHQDLDVQADDSIIIKPRISAFYNTTLESLLRAKGIDTLIICGVSSNYAVEMTVREAHDRDYKVITLKDACASHSIEAHESAFSLAIARLSTVISVDQL